MYTYVCMCVYNIYVYVYVYVCMYIYIYIYIYVCIYIYIYIHRPSNYYIIFYYLVQRNLSIRIGHPVIHGQVSNNIKLVPVPVK